MSCIQKQTIIYNSFSLTELAKSEKVGIYEVYSYSTLPVLNSGGTTLPSSVVDYVHTAERGSCIPLLNPVV